MYKQTQLGYAAAVFFAVLLGIVAKAAFESRLGFDWKLYAIVGVVIVAIGSLFSSLTIRVDGGRLSWHFAIPAVSNSINFCIDSPAAPIYRSSIVGHLYHPRGCTMFWIVRTGFAGLAVALPFASVSAFVVPQANDSEKRVWPSISEAGPLSGEIEYSFDTALNKTRARFKTSLASGNILVRVLSGPPTVHTLVAVYEFRGRAPAAHPDHVRLSLMSDEYKQASEQYFPLLGVEPTLVVSIGDTVVRYPLGISQRVEEWEVPNIPSSVSPRLEATS
ncbi:MAG: hypothetical protein NVSMB53_17530 [Gemmatimonadaceae bacterium]